MQNEKTMCAQFSNAQPAAFSRCPSNQKGNIMSSVLKAAAGVALVCVMSLMGGCVSSSSLVDVWKDPAFQVPPLGKMLVIAVRKDATKRRIWEDAFAVELAKHGVATTASYALFPDVLPDSDQVHSSVQMMGFDGVLVIFRLPTQTTKQYVHGYITTEQNVRYSSYWQRYLTSYREIEHPGYIDSFKVAVHEVNVSTTGNDGRLIWSAVSRTTDPASVISVQRGIVGLVITDLTKQNIISSIK